MKIKTSELIGPALDWAVAYADGRTILSTLCGEVVVADRKDGEPWRFLPSTTYSEGMRIADREHIATSPTPDGMWSAYAPNGTRWVPRSQSGVETYNWVYKQVGPTRLIAAMRCFVASKLGDEVEVPDELLP